MAFIRTELKQSAKNQLSGNWGTAIGAILLTALVVGLAAAIFSVILNFGTAMGSGTAVALGTLGSIAVSVCALPLTFGMYQFYLAIARRRPVTVTTPFEGYRRFGPAVVLGILYSVFLYLWSLLLVIPGIIKSFSYAMSFYILADDENIAPIDAITKSREMMNGRKAEYFVLQLSFIPWLLLVLITFGLASFYVYPYILATDANFYESLKAELDEGSFSDRDMENRAERAAQDVLAASAAAPVAPTDTAVEEAPTDTSVAENRENEEPQA